MLLHTVTVLIVETTLLQLQSQLQLASQSTFIRRDMADADDLVPAPVSTLLFFCSSAKNLFSLIPHPTLSKEHIGLAEKKFKHSI